MHDGGVEQLALDLPPPPLRSDNAVILAESNRDAATFAANSNLWPGPVACLVGPPGCGKTRIAGERFVRATPLQREFLHDESSPAALSPDGAAGRFWFDDVDAAHRAAFAESPAAAARLESALFHLINQLTVGGGKLLLGAQEPPALWPVALPDLRTRLGAALALWIDPPEDALLAAYMERRFQERGLSVSASVGDYLLLRLERSFAAIESATEALDKAALKEHRRITREFAARILQL